MTELYEKIPMERLQLLSKLSLEDYIKVANKKKYKMNEIKDHFKLIKSYIKDHIKCGGIMKKVYKYSESKQQGRMYGIHSIQNLDGIIRGFLFGTNTTDYDMKNAHPHILEWLCRTNDIRCPNLTEYVYNRETIIHKLKGVGIDDPKFEILKMLNTEKNIRIMNDCDNILKNLRDELKTIRGLFRQKPQFVEQLQEAMIYKPNNIEGSFINRILCIYENKIMNTMASYIHSKNLEIAEYAFDGILVYGNFYDNLEMLKEMEEFVNNTYPQLFITLTLKPHSNAISVEYLEALEEVEEINEEETYEYMKVEFEKTHAKIINKSLFIQEYDNNINFMKRTQLLDAYEHLQFKTLEKGKICLYSFISAWLKDVNIRRYDDMDCIPPPLVCPPNIYNIWLPFAMEHITTWEQKDISIFLNHFKIMCNHEEEVYDYLIKWLSQMIQYPAVKTNMLFFQGGEGCGKGTMFKIIYSMLGESKYLETTSPERDIWGQFNPLMANSFFVYLNELSKKQTYEAEHKIKALITDNKIQINIKGKDSFKTSSYHRFGGSSNDTEPINTHATDRRKVLVCASNELMNNVEYFKEINKYMDDVNYIKSFYEYLKSIPDMDKFNAIEKPITEYQKILCELSITPIEAFIRDMITDCEETELILTTKELFDKFKGYLHESKTNYEINIIKFGVRLTNLKLNGIETLRGKNSSSKKLDIPILKKHFGTGCLL